MEMPLPPLATLAPAEQPQAPTTGEAKDAYELLQSVYSNSALPIGMRMRAAIEALPFEKPKLAVTAIVAGGEGLAARLERAIKRSGKAIEGELAEREPLAIEHEPQGEPANGTVRRRA